MEAVREMAFDTGESMVFEAAIREQLLERREKLEEASRTTGGGIDFGDLLGQVDAALAKIDTGTYGKCEMCDGEVEPERLLADPLIRVCLGELSERERAALESDLELAAVIQRGLLPKMAVGHGSWQTDFIYQPVGPVSGDYCDVIPVDDDMYFILADVSGKGMAASLLMSSLHAIFHSLIPLGLGLEEMMTRANHLLVENSPANQFATVVLGKAKSDGGLELVNAGHLPPVLIKNAIAGELNFAGLPLGMFNQTHFVSSRVSLDRGDSLLLFTDGLTEAVNADGNEFGTCRLFEAINGNGWKEPSALLQKCLDHLMSHCGSVKRSDDLTMLAITYN